MAESIRNRNRYNYPTPSIRLGNVDDIRACCLRRFDEISTYMLKIKILSMLSRGELHKANVMYRALRFAMQRYVTKKRFVALRNCVWG